MSTERSTTSKTQNNQHIQHPRFNFQPSGGIPCNNPVTNPPRNSSSRPSSSEGNFGRSFPPRSAVAGETRSTTSSSSSSPRLSDRPKLLSRSTTERGRSWISCAADRSVFQIRSSSPSARYSIRRCFSSRSPSPAASSRTHRATSTANMPSDKDSPTLDTDGWRRGRQQEGSLPPRTSHSSSTTQDENGTSFTEEPSFSSPARAATNSSSPVPPTPSEVQRVRSFSSRDRHPWRHANSESPIKRQRELWAAQHQQHHDDDDASSDTASSYGHLSLPSDDCTGSSSTLPQSGSSPSVTIKSDEKSCSHSYSDRGNMTININNNKRHGNKCAAFTSDAAPYQVRRRDEDVLDHSCSHKSIHSTGNSSFRSSSLGSRSDDTSLSAFTPSVKIGHNETIFTNYQRLEDSNSDSESSSSSSSSTFSSSCSSSPSKKHARARGPSPENHPYMKLKQIRRTSPPLKTGAAGTAAATTATATPPSSSSSTMEQKELLSLPTFSTPTKSVIGPVSASHDKKKEAHSFIPAASPPPGQQQQGSSSTNIFRFGKVDDDFTGPSLEQAKPVSDDEDRIHRAAPNKVVGSVFRTRNDQKSITEQQEHTFFAPGLEVAKCISSDSNDVPSNQLLVGPFSTKEAERYEGSTRRTNNVQDGQVVLPKVDSTVVLGSSARQSSQHHFLETAAHPVIVPNDTKHVFRSSTNQEKSSSSTFVAPSLEKGKPLSSMEMHSSSSSTIFRDCSTSSTRTVANENVSFFPTLEHARPLSSFTHDELEDGSNPNRSIFRSTGPVDMTERGLVPSLEKANPLSPINAAEEDGEQRQDNANKIEREPHVILDVISSPMQSYSMTSSRVDESSRHMIGGHGTPRPSLPKTSSTSISVQSNLLPPPSEPHSSSSSSTSKPRGRRLNASSGASMGSYESIETGPPSPQRTRPPHDVAAEAMTPERMQRKESGSGESTNKEKKESSKTSLPSAMKRPSFGVGESNSSSSSAGVEEEDNVRKSPLRYDASEKRKVVTFPQTWLKRGDDYNEELFQKASLSSLVYKGDDAVAAAASPSSLPPSATATGEGMIVASTVGSTVPSTNTNATTTVAAASHLQSLRFPLTAPDSPDRSKSSLPSFSYSLDGTVGSGNSTSVERYGQEIKFPSKQQKQHRGAGKNNHNHNNRYHYSHHHHHHPSSNTNTMSLAFLPKIDETRKTETIPTIPVVATAVTTGTESLFLGSAVRNNNISPSSVITGATDHQQQRSTTSSSTTTSSSSSNSKGTSSAATKDSTNSIRGGTNDDASSSTDHVLSPGGCLTPLSSSSSADERPSATSIPVLLMQESETVTSDEVSLELMLLMEKQKTKNREEPNANDTQEGNANANESIASSEPSNNIPIIEGTAAAATTTTPATQGPPVPATDTKKKVNEGEALGISSSKKATEGGGKKSSSTLKWKLKPKPTTKKPNENKKSFVQPSPRDLILQRRKRMASPETNSILQQEDSSWEESNKIIIPNTIVVEHPSKQPPGNSQKEDSSPGSYSIETSTDKSGSEQHKTTTPLVVLHVDGMSLIERDGQTSMGDYEEGGYTIDDDEEDGDNNGGSNGQFGEYGYPEYPNDPSDDLKNSKDEVSSKCTSYFSARRSEDLSQLIPKEHDSLTPPKTDIGYHCARNRVVIVIVISALIAVGASATVVALLLFRSSSSSSTPVQDSSPTSTSSSGGGNDNKNGPWPIPPSTSSNSNNNNNPDTSQNDWPEIVLWSPEEEVNSGGLIDDLLDNNGEVPSTASTNVPFDTSEWIPFGQTIPLTFDSSSTANTQRDMTFSMSGNGQFLAVGVPFDTNQNGIGAGAVFLYEISSSSSDGAKTQTAATEEEGNEDPPNEEQQWGLVGLLLGTKEKSGFGSNVVLNDDGSTIVITSLAYNNQGENLIHVFHIEPITKHDIDAVASSPENGDNVNVRRRRRRRHLRGTPTGSGTTRKHEELYQHERFPDLVHNVKFISKALNHPTLPSDIMLHHASISISDDGTTVGIVASALAPSQEQLNDATFQSLAIFSYDQESDMWIDMNINVPSDFQPQYSWSCDLSGDGMTFAHSSVLMSDDDDDSGTTNHVMLWHWKESAQTWDHAELFSSDLFDKKDKNKPEQQRTAKRHSNRLSQQFGYSVSLNVDGTVLAIGAPSIIDRDNRSNNNEQLDLGYAVVARAIIEDPSSSEQDTSSTGTKVWGLAGDDVLKGTSFGFGRDVNLSKNGQRLVVGSPDHSVVTGGVTNVYQFMERDNRWMKAPNFHLMDPSNIGLGTAISSDGTKVMTGIGIPTMYGDSTTAEEVDDHDVITQKAFVEVYMEKTGGE